MYRKASCEADCLEKPSPGEGGRKKEKEKKMKNL